ncbi:lactose-binding lectin l-2-like [Anabas testudineus]|uniref:C-type lectin domain-containing protein n=1 Tax=Anabas testudineus TaxID=64144 RepID=A0A7N5ZR79_ANATE|nr:lactose-binding lectin l-2-like [Anabas testudineus]
MLLFLFFFALALAAVSPADVPALKLQRGNCPPFWYSFEGRCYKYIATRITWAEAELYCVSQRANLVSIHSLEEENFVKSLIMNFDHAQGRTWIGLSDIHREGSWMWSDGCPVTFAFWDAQEPNNIGGMQNCGHVNYETALKWNDIECSNLIPFVCASRIICP